MKTMRSSFFYLALTILLWSATPAVAKLALAELDNYQLLFYTSIVGTISLFIVNLFQGKLSLVRKYSNADFLAMFGMGFTGVFLYYVFLYGSFNSAPAGQVNVINYLWPIFVVIFSIPVLKEKADFKTLLAVVVSFSGALVAFTKGNFFSFNNEYAFGYLLAALGAVCYGLFSVLGKKFKYDAFFSMLVYYASATILIIPTSVFVSGFVIPQSLTTIISVLVLGSLTNSLAFVFWFKALKTGHTHKTANIVYIVPVLAMVWTYFLNSEPFSIPSIFGLLLILSGILIQLSNKQPASKS